MVREDEIMKAARSFTNTERERAYKVRTLHKSLAHPNNGVLGWMLDNKVIENNDLTSKDVKNSDILFGKCQSCMQGKITNKQPKNSGRDLASKPGMILHCDIVKFGGE